MESWVRITRPTKVCFLCGSLGFYRFVQAQKAKPREMINVAFQGRVLASFFA